MSAKTSSGVNLSRCALVSASAKARLLSVPEPASANAAMAPEAF